MEEGVHHALVVVVESLILLNCLIRQLSTYILVHVMYVVYILQAVQHSYVNKKEKSRTSNITKSRIKVGKRKEKVGTKRHIRSTLKIVTKFTTFLYSRHNMEIHRRVTLKRMIMLVEIIKRKLDGFDYGKSEMKPGKHHFLRKS